MTQNLTELKISNFQVIVSMWRPITEAIDKGDTSGELSIVGPFLAA